MLGDGDGVASAVVGDANAHLAQGGLVERVRACADGLHQLEVRRSAGDFDRHGRSADYGDLRVFQRDGLVVEGLSGVHPSDFDALGRNPLEVSKLRVARSVDDYLCSHLDSYFLDVFCEVSKSARLYEGS